MSLDFKETKQDKNLNRKIKISAGIVCLFFFFIALRLCYLQIIKGTKYAELSANNRIRQTMLPAPRGHILSRDNQTLVDNVPSFDLNLIPQDALSIDVLIEEVAALLKLNITGLMERVRTRRGRPPFEPITLKKNLTWNEMSSILSKKSDLPGISISVVPRRRYLAEAPHVVGFLGEVDQQDLAREISRPYQRGDLLGKYGLERRAEKWLRGTRGYLQAEVDAFGNRKKILAKIEPRSGRNITTTLISDLQEVAAQMLHEKTGAVVVMDPRNGHILALASAPGFDSNLFSRGIDSADWRFFSTHPYHPLLNRAIQTQQPPGSIFKIVTLTAALEEKTVDPQQTFFCPGFYELGGRRFNCWKREGHGYMNMKNALVQSCDTYFYKLALKVGIDTLVQYAKKLGFGEMTGIEIDGEKPGLLPSPEWKKKRHGSRWQHGDTLNFCIGQGSLLTTPLQMAAIYCGVANNGIIYRPRLLLNIDAKHGPIFFENKIFKNYQLKKETFLFLKDALRAVVYDDHGTGYNARVPGAIVAGKTGTAQVVSLKKRPKKGLPVPRHLENHAWFVAFSPVDEPEIVVSVFLEHGGGGGKNAAPIAREILKTYYNYKGALTRVD